MHKILKTKRSIPLFQLLKLISTLSLVYDLHENLFDESLIMLIFGKRGSGKSALGFRILENVYSKSKRK